VSPPGGSEVLYGQPVDGGERGVPLVAKIAADDRHVISGWRAARRRSCGLLRYEWHRGQTGGYDRPREFVLDHKEFGDTSAVIAAKR
jgi:hypothetical protein